MNRTLCNFCRHFSSRMHVSNKTIFFYGIIYILLSIDNFIITHGKHMTSLSLQNYINNFNILILKQNRQKIETQHSYQ